MMGPTTMRKKTETLDLKQVIVIRRDLKMSVGKIVAQGCHASQGATEIVMTRNPQYFLGWKKSGRTKIVLGVDSFTEMDHLIQSAIMMGMDLEVIYDAGRTEVAEGTLTAIAIGPAPTNMIDKITGSLKLL